MWRFRLLLARLNAFVWSRRADEEMSREMAAHLAILEDELRRRGFSAKEAEREARRRFGSLDRARDLHRETRSILWLEQVLKDLLYSARYLGANKLYTAVAVATLALGIGANSAVFSVVYSLMIEPLSFDRPEQLVQLLEQVPPTDGIGGSRRPYPLPPARSAELRGQIDSVAGLFQYFRSRTTLLAPGDPSSVDVAGVSEGTFPTLRTRPHRGRLLEPGDHLAGSEAVTVVSYSAWQRYWRGDSGAVGQRVELDTPTGRRSHRVVGVLPEDFALPLGQGSEREPDLWVPGDFSGHGTGSELATVLRVKDGVTIAAATDEVAAVLGAAAQTVRFDPATGRVASMAVGNPELVPLKSRRIERIRTSLLLLAATVAIVLLMACLNVASLMLARAATRTHEMAVRQSLGATRWRLSRQVLTESLVLCLAGGAVGFVVAFGGVRMMSLWPGNALAGAPAAAFLPLPSIAEMEINGAVLLFAFALTIVTGLLFGLAPALALAREAARSVSGPRPAPASLECALKTPRLQARDALVVAQVALAITLLVGAGLFAQSFVRLARVDPGFAPDGVVTFQVTASRSHFEPTPPFGGGVRYLEPLAESLRALPGVEAVGYGQPPFLFGSGNLVGIEIPGGPPGGRVANRFDIGGDYLRALGLPLRRGRGLGPQTNPTGRLSALVNETFVREHLGGRDPVGLLVRTSIGGPAVEAEIVGVVGDVRRDGLDSEPYAQVFVDYGQAAAHGNVDYWWAFFAVRTSQPSAVVENAASIVHRYDADARVESFAPFEDVLADLVATPRLLTALFGTFAIIGIALAAVGIFGIVSYLVTRRTHELGIRMALGAGHGPIFAMVLRRGAALAVIGVAFGLGAAVAGTRYVASLLFGIEPLDIPTFAAVAAGFFAVAMLATWLPARRATRIDPLVALRHE